MKHRDLIADAVRHNSWATQRLIEHCGTLPNEALLLSAEGTFGTIVATLAHLVRIERAYLARLRGEQPKPGNGGEPDLRLLAELAQRSSEDWEHLLTEGIDGGKETESIRGIQTMGILVAQALSHAGEHRAHVCTVLGAHGLDVPAIDPFAYGEARRDL